MREKNTAGRAIGVACAVGCGAYPFLYLLYHFLDYYALLAETPLAPIGDYLPLFAERAALVLHPVFAAALLFSLSRATRPLRAAGAAALLALPRLLYAFPYYYLYYFDLGYDTAGALVRAALGSLLQVLLLFAIEAALVFAARLVLWLRAKRSLPEETPELSAFDLSVPEGLALLCLCLPMSIYVLIDEILRAAGYLSAYAGDFKVGEILYMTLSFLFDLLLFLLSLLTAAAVKRRADRKFFQSGNAPKE